jgi:hypothetical protein
MGAIIGSKIERVSFKFSHAHRACGGSFWLIVPKPSERAQVTPLLPSVLPRGMVHAVRATDASLAGACAILRFIHMHIHTSIPIIFSDLRGYLECQKHPSMNPTTKTSYRLPIAA